MFYLKGKRTNKMKEELIIVDIKDKEIGSGEKMQVHKDGKLHRAFSIFVFNSKNELLLQKRAKIKYHSGGLWTNTCCGHPRVGEETIDAALRRLKEEVGFDCPLKETFNFIYKAKLDNNLFEHEFDHVFIGKHDQDPIPNPEEVEDWKWIDLKDLLKDVKCNPQNYTHWFNVSMEKVVCSL